MPLLTTRITTAASLLHGCRELLPCHQEVPVSCNADHDPLGVEDLRGDRRRNAVSHRPTRRCELRAVLPELVEAMRPDREVARPVREDRVGGQALAQRRHHVAHVECTRGRCVSEVREVVGASADGLVLSAVRIEGGRRGEREGEGVRRCNDPERWRVHATDLVRISADVNECLRRARDIEERVPRGRDLAEAVADHEQHVGVTDPSRQPRIGAEPEMTDVHVDRVVHVVLATPSRCDGHAARRHTIASAPRSPRRSRALHRRSRAAARRPR